MTPTTPPPPYRRIVQVWLLIGLVMIVGQIVIGGLTRLTGSGLSITKWEIVTGTLPPLNAAEWEQEFAEYRATPQYAQINAGMSMGEFKYIYFWEYFHRLWARSMGFVFLFPFLFFWRRGWLGKPLMRRLGVTVLLAAVVASFGWIMVASGLIDRPWVSAYKLTWHLSLAGILFAYFFWTVLTVLQPKVESFPHKGLKTWIIALLALAAVQLMLGGVVAGSRAALLYPTWPGQGGGWLPPVLTDASYWTVENFVRYEATPFFGALVQFLHRNTAYLLTIMVLAFSWQVFKQPVSRHFRRAIYVLISVLVVQVLLGILTLVNSIGAVPVALGVWHQLGAIVLIATLLYLAYQLFPPSNSTAVEKYVETH